MPIVTPITDDNPSERVVSSADILVSESVISFPVDDCRVYTGAREFEARLYTATVLRKRYKLA